MRTGPGYPLDLPPTLTTAPLERSRLEWFGTRSRKPIPRGLSLIIIAACAHRMSDHGDHPFCVLLQHTVVGMDHAARHHVLANAIGERV